MTDKPDKYFGSDLNRYMHEKCSKEMTVNNMDVVQYKRDISSLRIIESKHEYEKIPRSQQEILNVLSEIFEVYSKTENPKYNVGVYVVRSNPPYDNNNIVTDVAKNESIIMDGAEFKNWCEFKK